MGQELVVYSFLSSSPFVWGGGRQMNLELYIRSSFDLPARGLTGRHPREGGIGRGDIL